MLGKPQIIFFNGQATKALPPSHPLELNFFNKLKNKFQKNFVP